MQKYLPLLLFIGLAWGQLDTLWTKTFGGQGQDIGYEVIENNDGAYAIKGTSSSFTINNEVYFVKVNAEEWNKLLSSSRGHSILQTSNGGYNSVKNLVDTA